MSALRFLRIVSKYHRMPISSQYSPIIHIRNATSIPHESMQELYDSISTTFENLNEFTNFEMKQQELQDISKQMNNSVDDTQSITLSTRYDHIQQQVCLTQ